MRYSMSTSAKLLLVCPSRGRSQRISDFIESVKSTCNMEYTKLVILLDEDDESLEEYKRNIPSWVTVRIYDRTNDKTYTTEIINRAFEEFNGFEFYSVTNDDIRYLTKGWDKGLSQKHKISSGQDNTMVEKYGNDLIANVDPGTFPITSVICGEIVRKIGWLQYPELIHSAGDNIWYWIGRRSDCLYVDRTYKTIHESPYFGLADEDETFKRCNAKDNKQDYYTYIEWLKYKCGKELVKMEELIKKEATV